jgi:hypothetical protein
MLIVGDSLGDDVELLSKEELVIEQSSSSWNEKSESATDDE